MEKLNECINVLDELYDSELAIEARAELAALRAKNERIKDAWIVEQKLAVKYHEERQALRAENEKLRNAVVELSKGLFANNMADAVRLHSIIKEALK